MNTIISICKYTIFACMLGAFNINCFYREIEFVYICIAK